LKRGKIRVFEVDHPETQRAKKEKVRKIFGMLPDNVVYVSVDFNREKLDERLFESGYDGDLKTLFIWEAVTMFLTPEAVDETLASLASNSGEGSSIIFDYIFQAVAEGTCELKASKKFRKIVRRKGEPVTFGIEEKDIEEFLLTRGFHKVKNVSGESLKDAYFEKANQKIEVSPMFGYVHAEVKH
jgi:methyltransferase (TIGR00027 family)